MAADVDFAATRSAHEHRFDKATALAAWLAEQGIDAAAARRLTGKGRRAAERGAGVRRCSDDKTWPMVLQFLTALTRRHEGDPS